MVIIYLQKWYLFLFFSIFCLLLCPNMVLWYIETLLVYRISPELLYLNLISYTESIWNFLVNFNPCPQLELQIIAKKCNYFLRQALISFKFHYNHMWHVLLLPLFTDDKTEAQKC